MAKSKSRIRRQKPARRKAPKRPNSNRDGAQQADSMIGSFLNGSVTSRPIAAADMGAMQTYAAAHSILPPEFYRNANPPDSYINEALRALNDEGANAHALLRAIVVLGHTPNVTALEALRCYGQSDRPHAAIARMATDECSDWIANTETAPMIFN
jgi:hypothetical protein